ncbi:hypothetical protein GCM10012275_18690 [Longimycelium tulufanense]|uniref:Uncharacterized protein n=1 Tax=Longimycelium tulufanense TaxID=907463 RepID=A0A8J3CEC2_9PSEU|nr:hypothetical protein [Longimycelium tulufanense]GGM47903.1 hypothetical protein GCM10012275_18690 [Longimycelium tulufanense]
MVIAALFDLDGTLVDLGAPADDLAELRARLRALAEAEGVLLHHFGIFPMYRALCAAGRGAAGARTLIDSYEVRWARSTARPLVRPDLLAAPIRLVTSNGRACVQALRAEGLLPGGDGRDVTRDECADLKPSADPLLRAVFGLPADVSLPFVGDGRVDRQAVDAYLVSGGRPPLRFVPVAPGTGSPEPVRSADELLAELGGVPCR